MTITIYADPMTVNSRKVIAGMQFIGADYTLNKIDYFAGQHKEPDYLAVNPNGLLPSAKHNDLLLWESNAILQYAAEESGNSEVYPTAPAARADVNRWLLWEASSWFPTCYVYLVENCAKPIMGAETDQEVVAAQAEVFHPLANILDQRLANQTWLCGDAPTIADIAVAAPIHLHGAAKIPLADHPNLQRWMTQQVEQLPCWKATHVNDDFSVAE